MLNDGFKKELIKLAKEDISSGFVAGAAGGALSSLVVNPLDVINTQQSGQGRNAGKSIKSITKDIYNTQGFKGFYHGLDSKLIKVPLAMGITFGAGMAFKNILDKKKVEL